MKSQNYAFWQMAYQYNWVSSEQLKGAVKTESNPYGEISPTEYQEITDVEFVA